MYLLTYILILTLEYVVCGEPKDTQLSLEVLCAIKKAKTSNFANVLSVFTYNFQNYTKRPHAISILGLNFHFFIYKSVQCQKMNSLT